MSGEYIGVVSVGRSVPSRWVTRVGYAAFAWGLLFANAHAYWAFGGTALLGGAQIQDAKVQLAHDPRAYVFGWTILSLLFICEGLFPLALVWPEDHRIGQRGMRLGAICLGCAGMATLVVYGLGVQETGLIVLGCVVCAVGVTVALTRPGTQPVSRWMVLVATWVLGVAMIVYGFGYVVAAIGKTGSDLFLVYLLTGGLNWATGGVLFVATAWLANRRHQLAPFSGRRVVREDRG